jgi:hypothetical protein
MERSSQWAINGGNIAERVSALARSQCAGVLLVVEVNRATASVIISEDGAEESLLRAWQVMVSVLPAGAVGCRTLWSRFSFVFELEKQAAAPLGRRLLQALSRELRPSQWTWRIVFTEIDCQDSDRTLMCDPDYDLNKVQGNTIAWVRPYCGPDWRESQRYPSVTFLGTNPQEDEAS